MDNLRAISLMLWIVVGALLWVVLAVDALEYETTGKCQDCVILDKIRDLE